MYLFHLLSESGKNKTIQMMEPLLDEDILKFLKEIGVGTRPINDPFFDESYRVCKVFQRTGVTVEDDETLCHQVMDEFVCNAPGCQATFQDLLNFEVHYNSTHRYTCSECKKIKANPRLLEIHIQETHDTFFQILSEKQPMYQCYLSSCDIKFINAEMRREHCVSVHKFPKHFKFDDASGHKAKDNQVSQDLMEIDQLTKNLSISKKPKANLYKNQKMRTFAPHMKNTNEVSRIKTNPLPAQSSTSIPTSSSLVFIPRQLTHKPISKILTQGKSIEKVGLEKDSAMDLIELLST